MTVTNLVCFLFELIRNIFLFRDATEDLVVELVVKYLLDFFPAVGKVCFGLEAMGQDGVLVVDPGGSYF